jgi:hypothetical protein
MNNTSMVATAIALMVLGAGAIGTASAQTPAPADSKTQSTTDVNSKLDSSDAGELAGKIELTRAEIQVRRQALVTAAMDLQAPEADIFWPLYRDYRVAMAKVNDRYVKLLMSYLQKYDDLTDVDATRLMDEYLSIERARNGVKAKYVPLFREKLPARKVARFFQVDNKLDAIINADLASVIPLAR